jgi:processive 1,2-diacylglycerol beta-glucosyltransferase
MTARKVLLLSVSAGAGHVRAADALQAYAEKEFGDVQALHLDVMDYASATFRKLYSDTYIKLISKHPALWGMLYQMTADARTDATMHKLRRSIERLNTRALRKRIDDFVPDAIICTHFLPAEILMHEIRRGRLDVPVWVQVTDFDLHRMWVIPHMTGYFAANSEIAFRMRAAGMDASTVHVTGIPIMPAFAQPLDRLECAQALGADPQRRILLLMGGGAGVGNLEQVAEHLLTLPADFQLIVLAGKNAAALEALKKLASRYPARLFPQGYTNQVERLMACADLVITKPGGLTSSECLAMGIAMIVHSPIPGQEERNADYLLEQGAALKAIDSVGLQYRVGELLDAPERIAQMRGRAQALGRPYAAREVLRIVLAADSERQTA